MLYRSILKNGQDQFEEKKSIFIGYSFPVENEDQALDLIAKIKEKHKDATHNCWAYVLGPKKMIQRFDDDGEPSGTAGLPILEVIKREDLTNIVLVVTRYFGGTLLGSGGLIRAYSKGAKIAIDAGQIVDMAPYKLMAYNYDYVHHGKIMNLIETQGYKLIEAIYTDKVEIHLLLAKKRVDNLSKSLLNITSGQLTSRLLEERIEAEINGDLIWTKQ
ncbi:MAG: YigZ family protein [Bacillota bacterium]|nr:YigZ family protein [Bacillota bacterium]